MATIGTGLDLYSTGLWMCCSLYYTVFQMYCNCTVLYRTVLHCAVLEMILLPGLVLGSATGTGTRTGAPATRLGLVLALVLLLLVLIVIITSTDPLGR